MSRTKGEEDKEDARFREWVQTKPSCISGDFSEYVNGEGRNIAAHIRRAKHSGTSFKPLFSCVPLTDREHRLQSNSGELACLKAYLRGDDRHFFAYLCEASDEVQVAKNWFDMQAKRYLAEWERLGRP